MRYISLFSGIEAASVAWHPLGWECVAVAEIEPFPCAVLAHHYPSVPNLGNVDKVTERDIAALGRVDLIVFGSPCQDLSIAGKRAGLEGARSGLFYAAMRIVRWARKHCGLRLALWENVPGAFSSNEGRDFAAVVAAMAGIDHVAVPIRRWRREGVAAGDNAMLEWSVLDMAARGAMRRKRIYALADFGDWSSRRPILLVRTAVEYVREKDARLPSIDASGLAKKQTMPDKGRCWTVHDGAGHRFLTPEEVELSFGFPPGYTAIDGAKDGARYKAIGNSMAVPVMEWIGRNIERSLLA